MNSPRISPTHTQLPFRAHTQLPRIIHPTRHVKPTHITFVTPLQQILQIHTRVVRRRAVGHHLYDLAPGAGVLRGGEGAGAFSLVGLHEARVGDAEGGGGDADAAVGFFDYDLVLGWLERQYI